jgi:hypothetical protein
VQNPSGMGHIRMTRLFHISRPFVKDYMHTGGTKRNIQGVAAGEESQRYQYFCQFFWSTNGLAASSVRDKTAC